MDHLSRSWFSGNVRALDFFVTLGYIVSMVYGVILSPSARKTLRRLQPKLAQRIVEKLKTVAKDPYGQHNNVTALQGSEGYRLRVGDWRIIYELQDSRLVLYAVEIGPRGGIYQ